ncbi:MAG: uroporphyrinogen-III synthase [Gemmatimonadaceae bacterium]
MTRPGSDHPEARGAAPLSGVRVVVTRAAQTAASFSTALAALGADVVEMPATRIEPLDAGPLRAAIADLARYDWVLFTSQNAVQLFWEALRHAGLGARPMAGRRVAVVGPATAGALQALGIGVDVVPPRFVAESLLETLGARDDVRGRRVLYLAAAGARDVLPEGLRTLGATVDVIALYRSAPNVEGAAAMRERLLRGEIDVVTFTAGSSVRAFVDAVGADAAARAGIATIGPATSAVVRALGLTVRSEADPSTLDGLVAAVVASRR